MNRQIQQRRAMNITNKLGPMPVDEKAFAEGITESFAAMSCSPSPDFPSVLHRQLYGKSDEPEHEDNRDDSEFLDGYGLGLLSQGRDLDAIADEWERRGCPEPLPDGFRSWKRGYNAATMRKCWDAALSKANADLRHSADSAASQTQKTTNED